MPDHIQDGMVLPIYVILESDSLLASLSVGLPPICYPKHNRMHTLSNLKYR